jgi:hypothetical protein
MAIYQKNKKAPMPCAHQRSPAESQNVKIAPQSSADAPAKPADEIETAPQAPTSREKGLDEVAEEPFSSTESKESRSPCPVCKEEKRLARKYRWTLIAGLFLPFCLQALDATLIASALPFIASDFRKWPLALAVVPFAKSSPNNSNAW